MACPPHSRLLQTSRPFSFAPNSHRLRYHRRFSTPTPHIPTANAIFKTSEEVREALHTNKPVVALETTIYTHGNMTHGP